MPRARPTTRPPSDAVAPRPRLRTRLLVSLALVVVGILVLDGLADLIDVAAEIAAARPVAERRHTEYDADLGWINRPSVRIDGMYGPGRSLTTNAQRFRARETFAVAEPPGRVRVVCSGDSFTLGYGVDDGATWPARLEALDPRLQTVNMGQGGYGLDQAWLWYERAKHDLEHGLHLFTFVVQDFARMPEDTFMGYGKPVLELVDGELRATNVPVPRAAYALPWLARGGEASRRLGLARIGRRLFGATREARPDPQETTLRTREVTVALLDRLQAWHRQRGSELVVVQLPTRQDWRRRSAWREFLAREAAARGWIWIDLIPELSRLSEDEMEALFLRADEVAFPGAAGHYNERGNAYIAEALHRYLLARPEVRRLIDAR